MLPELLSVQVLRLHNVEEKQLAHAQLHSVGGWTNRMPPQAQEGNGCVVGRDADNHLRARGCEGHAQIPRTLVVLLCSTINIELAGVQLLVWFVFHLVVFPGAKTWVVFVLLGPAYEAITLIAKEAQPWTPNKLEQVEIHCQSAILVDQFIGEK